MKPLVALKAMGSEFLSGYIALADGEKDPRNLLLAFAIARVLLIEFEVTAHVEVDPSVTEVSLGAEINPGPVQHHVLLLSDHV